MPAWWNTLSDEELNVLEAEWRDREACESEAAMESHWVGVFAAMPEWVRRTRYRTVRGRRE